MYHIQPIEDIFQFFEDGMTVRIGQSIGSTDYFGAGLLIRWAAVGGFISGFLGAAVSISMTFIPVLFSFFVPTTTKSSLPTHCPVIPSVDGLQALAQPYWILTSCSWIACFINKSSIGFFMGTGETQFWAIATVAQTASKIIIFWSLIDIDSSKNLKISHTTTWGLTQLVPEMVFLMFTIACLGRKKYIDLFGFRRKDMFSTKGWTLAVQAAKDGVQLLSKDLVLTIQKSMALIMAAHLSLGSQYQLLLYNTVESSYGYSYGAQNNGSVFPIMLGYAMRLTGSRLLGAGRYEGYQWMVRVYVNGSILFGLVALIVIVIFKKSIPYYYSSDTLCEYAEYECSIDAFDDVFDGIDDGIIICGFMCWMNSVFNVLQACLYAALDFKYIRNCTLICFVVIYLPAVLVSFYKFQSVIGLLVAINLPILVLIGLFAHRLYRVILPDCKGFMERQYGRSVQQQKEWEKSLIMNDAMKDQKNGSDLNHSRHTTGSINQVAIIGTTD